MGCLAVTQSSHHSWRMKQSGKIKEFCHVNAKCRPWFCSTITYRWIWWRLQNHSTHTHPVGSRACRIRTMCNWMNTSGWFTSDSRNTAVKHCSTSYTCQTLPESTQCKSEATWCLQYIPATEFSRRVTNWRHLWSECKSIDPPKRRYICRASYHTTGNNHQSVDGLAAIPSQNFNFACDVLCVTVGCDVRLIKNINVATGLVNSANGTVVTVMYDNDDCSDLWTSTLQQVW